MSKKQVLSIGQCAADHSRISQVLENNFDVSISTSDDQADALTQIREGSFDLVLINRILDQTGSEGLEIIRQTNPAGNANVPPIMLVSNFDDAQKAAVDTGAVPGFGKAAIADAATVKLLKNYLA